MEGSYKGDRGSPPPAVRYLLEAFLQLPGPTDRPTSLLTSAADPLAVPLPSG